MTRRHWHMRAQRPDDLWNIMHIIIVLIFIDHCYEWWQCAECRVAVILHGLIVALAFVCLCFFFYLRLSAVPKRKRKKRLRMVETHHNSIEIVHYELHVNPYTTHYYTIQIVWVMMGASVHKYLYISGRSSCIAIRDLQHTNHDKILCVTRTHSTPILVFDRINMSTIIFLFFCFIFLVLSCIGNVPSLDLMFVAGYHWYFNVKCFGFLKN